MPGDGYLIDTQLTTDEVQSLKNVTARIEETLKALQNAAQTFKDNNSGVAIENYDEAQQIWDAGVIDMRDALHAKAGALGQITDSYIETDLMGSRLFG